MLFVSRHNIPELVHILSALPLSISPKSKFKWSFLYLNYTEKGHQNGHNGPEVFLIAFCILRKYNVKIVRA